MSSQSKVFCNVNIYRTGVLCQSQVTYGLGQTVSKICGHRISHFSSVSQSRDKATISFFMSLYLSVRLEHLGSHWTDFHEMYSYVYWTVRHFDS